MRSRQATSTLTCPARMSFTVINRVCHGAPPQPPGRRVPPCLPTPGDVTQPAQPPSSTVRGRASLDGEVGVFPETEGVHLQTGRFGVTVESLGLEPVDPSQQCLQCAGDRVRLRRTAGSGSTSVRVGPARGDHLTWHPYDQGVVFDRADQYRVGPDPGVVADGDVTEHLRACSEGDPVADGRVAFAAYEACSAEGDGVVDRDIVADLGRLADYHAVTLGGTGLVRGKRH